MFNFINLHNIFYNFNINNKPLCGIVGYGQIGSALNKIYKKYDFTTIIRDPYCQYNDTVELCDIVNITIPFFSYDLFLTSLQELALNPKSIIIIHSTVAFGTINKLQDEFPDNKIIHSSVRGIHPNLMEGIQIFEKQLGISDKYFNDQELRKILTLHFISLNIKTFISTSNESELAKILSTSIYGLLIALTEDIGKICDHHNLNFDMVYTKPQITYNEGYTKLGLIKFVRPVLSRIANEQKVIGGHCVIPNSILLKNVEPKDISNNISDFILRYSNENSLVHNSKNIRDV